MSTAERTLVRARDIALDVLERLSDRERLLTTVQNMPPFEGGPKPKWESVSVAFGDAGLALAFGHASFVERSSKWEEVAHSYLVHAVQGVHEVNVGTMGLLSGLAGVAFSVNYLSNGLTRHVRTLQQLESLLIERTRVLTDALPPGGGLHPSVFDVAYGLSGIGRYLLLAAHRSEGAQRVLEQILHTFVRWSLLGAPQGFYVPPSHAAPSDDASSGPSGYFDIGLAHGLPGPLALISLAHAAGLEVPGLAEAATALVRGIQAAIDETIWGPDVRPRLHVLDTPPPRKGLSRTAWCYGNPGVARSLQIAGQAFNKPDWLHMARKLMDSALNRDFELRAIPAPSLCHGIAGLAVIVRRFYGQDSSHGKASSVFEDLTRRVVSLYNPGAAFGFRNVEINFGERDDPSFLTGAAGTALALISGLEHDNFAWDAILMLS